MFFNNRNYGLYIFILPTNDAFQPFTLVCGNNDFMISCVALRKQSIITELMVNFIRFTTFTFFNYSL